MTGSFEAKEEIYEEILYVEKGLALCFKATWFEKLIRENKIEENVLKAVSEENISGVQLEPLS